MRFLAIAALVVCKALVACNAFVRNVPATRTTQTTRARATTRTMLAYPGDDNQDEEDRRQAFNGSLKFDMLDTLSKSNFTDLQHQVQHMVRSYRSVFERFGKSPVMTTRTPTLRFAKLDESDRVRLSNHVTSGLHGLDADSIKETRAALEIMGCPGMVAYAHQVPIDGSRTYSYVFLGRPTNSLKTFEVVGVLRNHELPHTFARVRELFTEFMMTEYLLRCDYKLRGTVFERYVYTIIFMEQ